MGEPIRVAILDDHLPVADGYRRRLENVPGYTVVADLSYGEELEPFLQREAVDVLLLDISLPMAPDNHNPFPTLHAIARIHERYPGLNVVVISMHKAPPLIQGALAAGARGYILKDDRFTLERLPALLHQIIAGDVFISARARRMPQPQLLSTRQLEALSLATAYPDATTQELAQRMNVADSTVRNLLAGAYRRLHVRSRAAAIAEARHLRLLPDAE